MPPLPTSLNFDAIARLVSPVLVAVFGGITKKIVEGKPKVISYLVHASSHPLNDQAPPQQPAVGGEQQPNPPAQVPQAVHTHAVVVKNAGKKSAHNVRINHYIFPVSYRIYPPVNHTVTRGQGESAEICIPVLVPGEQVTLSYLYFPPLLWNQIVGEIKSDEAMGRIIQTIPTPRSAWYITWLVWALMFVGASTIVYWLLRLLPFVL